MPSATLQKINIAKTEHGRKAINKKHTTFPEKTRLFSIGDDMTPVPKAAKKSPKVAKAMEFKHAIAMKKAGMPDKMVKQGFAKAAAMKKGGMC
jgi:2-oxoglutarate dehydrogenase complex dehydrogenase (E1) component-like enzyme